MKALEEHWSNCLAKRRDQGNLRQLRPVGNRIDFYSNDYLGLSSNSDFPQMLLGIIGKNPRCLTGSTGSRLISGNSQLARDTEGYIASLHQVDAALLFSSGYSANIALFSCVVGRHDTILLDELVHRSVYDGCLISKAKRLKFRHNDTEHLEELLKKSKGKILIAIESLYSMDGDFAPLNAIADLAQKYGAGLIVDEAHALGTFGKGLVHSAQVQNKVLATVVTYGKAMGVQGAAILGSFVLKEYLINFASPFIYSTAMSDIQYESIQAAYQYVDKHTELAIVLQERIRYFRAHQLSKISQDDSPIQAIQFTSTDQLRKAVQELAKTNMQTYAVFSPTVKQGDERLRICLHLFNSNQEIDRLCSIISNYEYR
ncbi:8-amino-7-oxononanoate synthase [Algoriphagus sp. 4150]|uniref:aminotransferase class I/II-fold pyridoxal phosphate-dependent enzyme n=1 Tax=Algoriphagus sp. 4150 TaxID=2817756 RepID=UPI00286183C3|nr:pyridoxal phosphate-dependent aminotransferase family protein [Algoriphagus sp. 4150]MDR7130199.1 8-amino-7-oxononanoate synthase [Algoriphagus sp. 4150]